MIVSSPCHDIVQNQAALLNIFSNISCKTSKGLKKKLLFDCIHASQQRQQQVFSKSVRVQSCYERRPAGMAWTQRLQTETHLIVRQRVRPDAVLPLPACCLRLEPRNLPITLRHRRCFTPHFWSTVCFYIIYGGKTVPVVIAASGRNCEKTKNAIAQSWNRQTQS